MNAFLFEINLLLWRVSDCKSYVCINYLYMCVPYNFSTFRDMLLFRMEDQCNC